MPNRLTWKQWKAKAAASYKPNVFTAKDMIAKWGFPSDVDPEQVQILFRKGVPGTKNKDTRRQNKLTSEQKRKENLKAISTQEFVEWGKRNGFSNEQIAAAVKAERAGKRAQSLQIKASSGQLEADHVTPQPTQKPKPLQPRFNAIAPGDALANREVKPATVNRVKSDTYPSVADRQQAERPLTRSGAIQQRFAAIRFAPNPLSPINSSSAFSVQGSIEAQTNMNASSTAMDMGIKLAN